MDQALMLEFLEMNTSNDTFRMISDNFGIFGVCIAGILAITTPLVGPMWFMPNERERYVRIFRNANIVLGPSAGVFAILLLFWNIVLPLLGIPDHQAITIIGSAYVYILMAYSIIDEPCTPIMSVFLCTNLITTMAFYKTKNTLESYITIELLLIAFISMCWNLHLRKHSLKQNIQWYIWYAGTFGDTLRW